tara:strand:+ start:1318 stop:1647 length:330 start_codon:yes stop_codon:yes gene_type:complete
MADSGAFDQITDSLETLVPSIFNFLSSNVLTFFKKYKYQIKLLILFLLAGRVFYRMQFLNIKTETVNLQYKFIGQIINIVFVFYLLFKNSIKKDIKVAKKEITKDLKKK